jgi:outer membrane lipoprotein-sorting protein
MNSSAVQLRPGFYSKVFFVKYLVALSAFFLFFAASSNAQDVKALLQKVKLKYDKVNDYTASGKMKTNVLFIKAPVANVKIYYKRPDKMKIKNENGVSFIPKGTVNINMNSILGLNNYEAYDGGIEKINGTDCKVVKIFPMDDKADISRATLYIDETKELIMKSVVKTENGTYDLLMKYGSYAVYGLPDKVELSFNTKDYKLPKGITIDYDNGTSSKENETDKEKNKKGKVEINYSSYSINKGVDDAIFK